MDGWEEGRRGGGIKDCPEVQDSQVKRLQLIARIAVTGTV